MARVLISLPDGLLERIDREVARAHGSRSAFFQDAARRRLGWPDPERLDAALERARAALAGTGPFESAEVIRADRDARDERDRRRR